MSSSDAKSLYRFRPLKWLLDHNELENLEIYFASPSELNDPMEGFADIFWQGDSIVWSNLFRHYLLCVYYVSLIAMIGGKTHPATEDDIPVFLTYKKLPTDKARASFDSISEVFFANSSIHRLIEHLSSSGRKVGRQELLFYLSTIQSFAWYTAAHELMPRKPEEAAAINKRLAEFIEKICGEKMFQAVLEGVSTLGPTFPDVIFRISQEISSQNYLLNLYNDAELAADKNRRLLTIEFPSVYLAKLEALMYPPWYAACFLEEIENAALWAHYGDSHKGVCLKYKTGVLGDTSFHLKLNAQGFARDSRFEFHKVNYERKYPEIDFFRSLGSLSIPDLEETWYSDRNGNFSECSEGIFSDRDSWRTRHWKTFYDSRSTKLKEWSYEKEHRLILAAHFTDFEEPSHRKVNYRFEDLEGIVFGIKTPIEDQIRIMRIIDKKCDESKRKDFKFYRAVYRHDTGKIETAELKLIKRS